MDKLVSAVLSSHLSRGRINLRFPSEYVQISRKKILCALLCFRDFSPGAENDTQIKVHYTAVARPSFSWP